MTVPTTVCCFLNTPTTMGTQLQSTTIDSLPKQFVAAMRTLFDIMDDKRNGFVNFADIEHRWQDDGTKGLPKGVIESLQKVTPPNGRLTFERFCAGLKICLLRNQVEGRTGVPQSVLPQKPPNIINRPPSAPLLDLDNPPNNKTNWQNTQLATVRPNNVIISTQRTLSMPQLLTKPTQSDPDLLHHNYDATKSIIQMPNPSAGGKTLYGPPKPPRSNQILDRERNLDRAEIRTALQNWQIGLMMNETDKNKGQFGMSNMNSNGLPRPGRSSGDGKPSGTQEMYQKKSNVRRREPRRHTLQNGIDYNMLKKMKQIEQEKDVLMQGLQAIEKARDWYFKQIGAVQDKMKCLGRMGSHMEQWTEAQQERLELQRARVLEVNRHLLMLTDSWERGGLPLHMNLAVHAPYHPGGGANTHGDGIVSRLKNQNHLLTEEVGKKSERITMLEREKASLIRELLQNRATNRPGQEEAVF